ncbi:hypothetical protein OAP63_07700 [Vibrio sp.]|nr:hypothetical protein [Vibrio sp.]
MTDTTTSESVVNNKEVMGAIWVIYRMVKGLIRVLDCKPFNDSIA